VRNGEGEGRMKGSVISVEYDIVGRYLGRGNVKVKGEICEIGERK